MTAATLILDSRCFLWKFPANELNYQWIMTEQFYTAGGARISLAEVVLEITGFMRAQPLRRYKITIGTDSELLTGGLADFVTAVVVHRIGNGGRYFWRRLEGGKFHTLRDRIIKEVLVSLDLGKDLLLALKELDGGGDFPEWDFEIHADVGENGETKSMIQEIVAMIRANNFRPITKPASYAASNVADRHV